MARRRMTQNAADGGKNLEKGEKSWKKGENSQYVCVYKGAAIAALIIKHSVEVARFSVVFVDLAQA